MKASFIKYLSTVSLLAGSSLLCTLTPLSAGATVTFTNNTYIDVTNTTYDAQDIVVSGCTVTVNGTHGFNSAQLTNAAMLSIVGGNTLNIASALTVGSNSTVLCQGTNASGQVSGQWAGVGVTINASNVTVEAGGSMSADGQGYTTGMGPGGSGSYATGGSYGGQGSGNGGPTYGSATQPTDLGSAGGGAYGGSSHGGGAIALNVPGNLVLDGAITANGQSNASGNNAGGAGGSVWITTGNLTGSGTISANGNQGSNAAGGGGRIAVYYVSGSGYSGFANCAANGGGTGAANGTVVFFDTSGTNNGLYVYQQMFFAPNSALRFATVTLGTNATLTLGGGSTLQVDNGLMVQSNAILLCQGANTSGQVSNQWAGIGVTINASHVTVEAGGAISADGQGYTTGAGPGGSGSYATGGSYGGQGSGNGGPTYGSATQPTDLGSAGGGAYGGWSCGGGAIALNVPGNLVLDGAITANGQSNAGGNDAGGAGGSVWITTGNLTGSGTISANGNQGVNAAGGGGRIAVYYASGSGYSGFANCTANGGGIGAANGTVVFFDTSVSNTGLYVYQQMVYGQSSALRFATVTLGTNATLTLGGGSTLQVDGGLVLHSNAVLVCQGANTSGQVSGQWVGIGVTINASNVTVEAGAQISADGQGYTTGAGPGGCPSDSYTIGGSYGGQGSGNGGPTYGSATEPTDLGSAGGGKYGGWSRGGGAIMLNVSGGLLLNGLLTADGQAGAGGNDGGGAGGSIWVTAGPLAGTGAMTANGAQGSNGSGGGGRIAVYSWGTVSLPISNITAAGYQTGSVFVTSQPLIRFVNNPSIWHGTEAIHWQALALDPNDTVEVTISRGGVTYLDQAGKLGSVGGADWTTVWNAATQSNGVYQVMVTFLNQAAQVVGQISQDELVNNSVAWHEGTLSTNQTWTSNTVNVVDQNVIIPNGVTVTIQPGVIVKFASGTSITVQSGGVLNAPATIDAPIVFTSLADDTAGGDTNMDGDNSRPQPGDWTGINVLGGQFNQTAYVDIRYLVLSLSGTLAANQSLLGTYVYVVTNNVVVPEGITLTINPGAILKFAAAAGITVQAGTVQAPGTLNALGTLAQPITFTSLNDDSVGGDTNGDGGSTKPAPGDWVGLSISGLAALDHCNITYGGNTGSGVGASGVIIVEAATLNLSNSVVASALWDGLSVVNGVNCAVVNSVLRDLDRAVLCADGGSIHLLNCTFDQNLIAIDNHGATTILAENCILANSIQASVSEGAVTTRYCDSWSSYTNSDNALAGVGQNGNISADPKFVNEAQGDYRLNYGSPCIDAADTTVAPPTDFMGDPRYNDPRTLVKTGIPNTNGVYADIGAFEFVETAPSDVDLIVTSVAGPPAMTAGDTVNVQWTEANIGSGNAIGPWHDALSLVSASDTNLVVTVADQLTGQGLLLGPGESCVGSAQVVVPALADGQYRWQVHVNYLGEVFEGANWTNNVTSSDAVATAADPSLDLGQTVTNSWSSAASSYCYQFYARAGQQLVLQLDNADDGLKTEVLVKFGSVPTINDYDLRGVLGGAAHQTLEIPDGVSGEFYVLLWTPVPASTASTFTLGLAQDSSLSLSSIDPPVCGNTGQATIRIQGGDLDSQSRVFLVGPTNAYEAARVFYQDSTTLYATFDVGSVADGTYDVEVRQQDLVIDDITGTNSVLNVTHALRGGFAVKPAQPGQLELQFIAPGVARQGRPFDFSLEYQNTGFTDLRAPLITVTAPGAQLQIPGDAFFYDGALQVLGIGQEGPADVLRPGQSGTVRLSAVGPPAVSQVTLEAQPAVSGPGGADFTSVVEATGTDPSSPAGAAMVACLPALLGTTWDSYQQALADRARQLSQGGVYESSVRALLAGMAAGCLPLSNSVPGSQLAAAAAATPLPFAPGGVTPLDGTGSMCDGYPSGAWHPIPIPPLHYQVDQWPNPMPSEYEYSSVRDVSYAASLSAVAWGFTHNGFTMNYAGAALNHFLDKTGTTVNYGPDDPFTLECKPDFDAYMNSPSAPIRAQLINLVKTQAQTHNLPCGGSLVGYNGHVSLDEPGPGGIGLTFNQSIDARYVWGSVDAIDLDLSTIFIERAGCKLKYSAYVHAKISDFYHWAGHKVYYPPSPEGVWNWWACYLEYWCEAKGFLNVMDFGDYHLSGECDMPDCPPPDNPDGNGSCPPPPPPPPPPPGPGPIIIVNLRASQDPNFKATIGAGPDNYLAADTFILYTVGFENLSNATAKAQEVVVTDALAPTLDWSSFELVALSFANQNVQIPPGSRSFDALVPVATDPNPVHVTIGLDQATGVLRCDLRSEDPVTHSLPADPLAGFLPPNNGSNAGQGELVFQVRPLPGLANNTLITNRASIVFDVNTPILTGVVTNTIDSRGPSSSVSMLPATDGTNILLSWSGNDSQSGIAAYDVYVSTNGGPWHLWLDTTTNTTAIFQGALGNTYGFYSIARDEVGNDEPAKTTADTVTQVEPPPMAMITSGPADNAQLTNAVVQLAGRATDNVGVASVQWRMSNAQGINAWQSANGTTNWSITVSNLVVGLNTITVQALDASGNPSAPVSRSYVLLTPLTVTLDGCGSLAPDYSGATFLEAGSNYVLTAIPCPGYSFAGWTGGLVADTPTLAFVMRPGLVLQANFAPLAYAPTNGTYYGLFCATDVVTHSNSGSITLTATARRSYSGKLQIDGSTFTISGQFTAAGVGTNLVKRTRRSPLDVTLVLLGSDWLIGTVSSSLSNEVWTADISADRAVFDGKKRLMPEAGRYTLMIAGANESTTVPGGDGYGTLTVSAAGIVSFAGSLADGTKVSQSVPVSQEGLWPLYAPLYSGQGSIISWIGFTNAVSLGGGLVWTKPASKTAYYPDGFSWLTEAFGASYSAPGKLVNILGATNSAVSLTLEGGNLPSNLSNLFTLNSKNQVRNPSLTNKLMLTFTPSSGLFSGSQVSPDTRKAISFQGVLLQNEAIGTGFFQGTNQVGRVRLTKEPAAGF